MTNKFITVPKDQKAMYNLNHGIENQNELIEWNLTEKEFNEFFYTLKLNEFINDICDSLIDDFESEQIENREYIVKLQMEISKAYDKNDPIIKKILNLIEEARDRETFIGFYF